MTYARVVIAIVFGLIVGSLFSALHNDTIGALGKTGYIFLSSFLVLMLSAGKYTPQVHNKLYMNMNACIKNS